MRDDETDRRPFGAVILQVEIYVHFVAMSKTARKYSDFRQGGQEKGQEIVKNVYFFSLFCEMRLTFPSLQLVDNQM